MAKSSKKLSKMEKKTKILMYADAPTCATGFGTVTRNIAEALHKTGKYDIDIFGINYWGDPFSSKEMPYRIWPAGTNAQRDPYGRQKFAQMALQMDFDILFLLQDTFILNFIPQLVDKLPYRMLKLFITVPMLLTTILLIKHMLSSLKRGILEQSIKINLL